jgi:hypothetical protein
VAASDRQNAAIASTAARVAADHSVSHRCRARDVGAVTVGGEVVTVAIR